MINLIFEKSNIKRKEYINGRRASVITPENQYRIAKIDLDKLNKQQEKLILNKTDSAEVEVLKSLTTEELIAKDIISDFEKTGWRLTKENGRNN